MTPTPTVLRSRALDLTDALYEAALDLTVATINYGEQATTANRDTYLRTREALNAAHTKLREHLTRTARSDRTAA